MPRRPRPLPRDTPDVFTVARGLELGIGRPRSRRRDLDARIHGVRISAGSADDLVTRCRAFAARLVEEGRTYRLDLAWPGFRFAVEYQGDGHRTREQWRRDMRRREQLRLNGWTILELNGDDLSDHTALVALIRRGIASARR